MKVLKLSAVIATLACVAVLGLALGPTVYGQSRGRELTVLSGRGGELGIRISDAASGGVQIEEVQADSPAEKAGLKRGDVIVELDGERVRSGRQFARLVQETPAGRTVKATILRNGQRQDVQVTPSEGRAATFFRDGDAWRLDGDAWRGFADQFSGRDFDRLRDLGRLGDLPFNFQFDFPGMTSSGRLGVTVDDLTRQLSDYFGAKDGVLVTSVDDNSPASRAGIKAGDVITSVDGQRVASRADLVGALRRAEREEVTIGIVRDKKESSVKAKLEAPRRTPRGARPA